MLGGADYRRPAGPGGLCDQECASRRYDASAVAIFISRATSTGVRPPSRAGPSPAVSSRHLLRASTSRRLRIGVIVLGAALTLGFFRGT